MTIIPRTAVYLTLAIVAGCSSFQASTPPEEGGDAAATQCPVCPAPDATEQCPEPQVVEKIVKVTPPVPVITPPPKATTAGDMHLPIVGAIEWVTIEPGDIRLEARMDTGAETTSIHAEDIQLVEKDGKRWVHFSLLDPATDEKISVEQRLRKKIRVKQSDGNKQTRYVVQLWISIGKTRSLVDVTLSDREHMEYPMLIGRNMLVDTMIVDVSDHHLTKAPSPSK